MGATCGGANPPPPLMPVFGRESLPLMEADRVKNPRDKAHRCFGVADSHEGGA
jgi:hypothetical protein